MVIGSGIDLVDIDRIEQAVACHGQRFLDKVFTPGEQSYCAAGSTYPRLAARFAAKEAVMKALGTGWTAGVSWLDIEVTRNGGRPEVLLSGTAKTIAENLGVERIHISLTHAQHAAAAVAIAESVGEGAHESAYGSAHAGS